MGKNAHFCIQIKSQYPHPLVDAPAHVWSVLQPVQDLEPSQKRIQAKSCIKILHFRTFNRNKKMCFLRTFIKNVYIIFLHLNYLEVLTTETAASAAAAASDMRKVAK